MISQCLFSREKIKIDNLSSDEFTKRVVSVKFVYVFCGSQICISGDNYHIHVVLTLSMFIEYKGHGLR